MPSAVAECEDIAMNLLASVVLRSAPQAVDMVAEHRRDTADARRKEGRSKCLNDLIELFKGQNPLKIMVLLEISSKTPKCTSVEVVKPRWHQRRM